MRDILLRDAAKNDLREYMLFIDKDDAKAAKQLSIAFENTTKRIAEFPEIGRICGGKIQVYKCLITDYNAWVVYIFSDDEIDVLRVIHTSMDFDKLF